MQRAGNDDVAFAEIVWSERFCQAVVRLGISTNFCHTTHHKTGSRTTKGGNSC
jgi:hypothetical protein